MNSYLGNIAIWAHRFDAMRNFYSIVLGIPESASGARPRDWVIYGNETFSFSLNRTDAAPSKKGWARCPMQPAKNDVWDPYVTVYVADLDSVIGRCREAGIELHTTEHFSLGEGFGRSIEARDPDGNTVAITQR